MQLDKNQLRMIGCLIEKSLTTPDQYPLSVNALTNACNQKSNRDPVMSLSESEIQDTIYSLAEKQLIMNQSGHSSRVQKYKHRFCNTEFGELQLSAQELGIICVLFLRGPQTPGELRTRTNRLCEFKNVQETEAVLTEMIEVDSYVVKLEREPGKRESRYMHCFADSDPVEEYSSANSSTPVIVNSQNISKSDIRQEYDAVSQSDRIEALEEQVELMQMEIDELRQLIEAS